MLLSPRAQMENRALVVKDVPPPLKGINVNDPFTSLEAGYALRLVNWTCRSDGLKVRPGLEVTSTLAATPVQSLIYYPGTVFGRQDGKWRSVLVPNQGGLHSLSVSETGHALPIRYDGSSWGLVSVTGVSAMNMRAPCWHMRRVFFTLTGTLDLYYLGLDAIGGPASLLPLGAIFQHGGSIADVGKMTSDNGRNENDALVVITTKGELAIFDGTDPDNAATWKLRGVWKIPAPVGGSPIGTVGGQAAVLTVEGAYGVPSVLAQPSAMQPLTTLTAKVNALLLPLAQDAGARGGVIDSAANKVVLVNVGSSAFVQDLETGGWSSWSVPGANCWIDTPDGIYVGTTGGTVGKLTAGSDDGVSIKTLLVDRYDRLGSSRRKVFRRVRPIWRRAAPYRPRMEIRTDYLDPPASWLAADVDSADWYWPQISWPMQPAYWQRAETHALGPWRGVSGRGTAAAILMAAQFVDVDATYTGAQIAFQQGSDA